MCLTECEAHPCVLLFEKLDKAKPAVLSRRVIQRDVHFFHLSKRSKGSPEDVLSNVLIQAPCHVYEIRIYVYMYLENNNNKKTRGVFFFYV